MPTLTIYSAAYNRENLLPRLYDSLKKQTNKDFLWLIIDDGSTDGTKEKVSQWIHDEKEFEIRYYYKENGGVHTARDAAYRLCDTELIMSEDSDDWLYDYAVEALLREWKQLNDKEYAGILTHEDDLNGKNICPTFPTDVHEATLQDFIFKHGCTGEKYTMVRADLMKAIPNAPVFQGEKLVGESFKWIQLPEIPFLLLNISVGVKHFQENGLSSRSSNYFFENPKGYRETGVAFIKFGKYIKARVRGHLMYITSCVYLKEYRKLFDSPDPIGTLSLFPIGYLVYFYLRIRRYSAQRQYLNRRKNVD